MAPRPTTPVRVSVEHGDAVERHESWITVRANRIQATPGVSLFDSEIRHRQFIRVTVAEATRRRDLSHDWIYAERTLFEFSLSQAQWGAFVSSFGDGTGVPATLTFDHGRDDDPGVPASPYEPRTAEGIREVQRSGEEALNEVQVAFQAIQEAFDRGAGKKEMRELLHTLKIRMENGPKNMAFAAKSLTEHVENTVTKARADVEAMVLSALQQGGLELGPGELPTFELGSGA